MEKVIKQLERMALLAKDCIHDAKVVSLDEAKELIITELKQLQQPVELIEKLEAEKEVVYYINDEPNMAPFAKQVNSAVDSCIELVRQYFAGVPLNQPEAKCNGLSAPTTQAPTPKDEGIAGLDVLSVIADTLQSWLDYNSERRRRDGLATTDEAHVIVPPTWPTHGAVSAWIKAIRSAAIGIQGQSGELDARKIMKMTTPLAALIGTAKSADHIDRYSSIDNWARGLLESAAEAEASLDALIAYLFPPTTQTSGDDV